MVCGVSVCGACFAREHYHPAPRIYGYSHRPVPNFLGNTVRTVLYLGVELEADNGDFGSDGLRDLWSLSDDEKLFYLKYDSSLRNGVEVVTHPATLDYHRRKFPWRAILQKLEEYNFKSYRTTTCGLHVHASKAGLGRTPEERESTMSKLVLLFWRHWDEIVAFSRRTPGALRSWSRGNHTVGNESTPVVKKLYDCKYSGHRYVAINTQPPDTIEFRLFRGTLEYGTLMAAVEFVQTVIELCRQNGTTWVYNSTWEDIRTAGRQYRGLDLYFKRLDQRKERLAAGVTASTAP